MSPGPLEDTAVTDVQSVQKDTARALAHQYGVTAWFGHHTREWWALVDGRLLVWARCPEQLGRVIVAARTRNAAGPGTGAPLATECRGTLTEPCGRWVGGGVRWDG